MSLRNQQITSSESEEEKQNVVGNSSQVPKNMLPSKRNQGGDFVGLQLNLQPSGVQELRYAARLGCPLEQPVPLTSRSHVMSGEIASMSEAASMPSVSLQSRQSSQAINA
jgi:hypothetical protein